MNFFIAVAIAVTTGAVVAALVVAAVRRQAVPVVDPGEDLRVIHHQIGQLMGRIESGFDRAASDNGTVRAALDMLTHNSGTRGTWGEVTLRRLLESAGLRHGDDFDTQPNLDGRRPDVVIDLGSAGMVIVDAKAPLDDLRRAWEADSDDDHDSALRAHAAAVRRHAADLAGRGYPDQVRATFAPVVMFLPVEGAWEAAVSVSPDLHGELLRLGVHPASPSTIGLVLDLVKRHALTVNQEEAVRRILEDARTLLLRLGKHAEHLGKVGRGLGTAVDAYNSAVGNLATRVLPATDRMADHLSERQPEAPPPVTAAVHVERVPRITDSERVA